MLKAFLAALSACLISFACANPEAKQQEEISAAKSCESQTICTREYQPTLCLWAGKSFSGANPCEAKFLAQQWACQMQKEWSDADLKCQADPQAWSAQAKIEKGEAPPAKHCQSRGFCTREYDPQVCEFQGLSYEGSNRCESMQNLKQIACQRSIPWDENKVVCRAKKASP